LAKLLTTSSSVNRWCAAALLGFFLLVIQVGGEQEAAPRVTKRTLDKSHYT
jgi:hypothetical protein